MRVIPTPVPQVDVVHDGFDWLALAFGAAGVIAAIIAIVIAVRAQRSIADERRRQFELEILGRILADVEETDLFEDIEFKPHKLRRYSGRLQLIDDPMPYWTRVMSANWYAELFPRQYERQGRLTVEHFEIVKQWEKDPDNADLKSEMDRLAGELVVAGDEVRAGVRRGLLNDLERAIRERVDTRR